MNPIRLELPPAGVLTPNDEHDPLPYYYRPGLGRLYQLRLTMTLSLLQPAARVLEVGVGSGVLVPTLTKHFPHYTGTDLVLQPGLERLVAPGCDARFMQADLLDEGSLPEESFDAIVCVSVLEHIRERGSAARSLARALRRGGRLVAAYPMVNQPMSRAFEMIGFLNIDHHHHSSPRDIELALGRELVKVDRVALPPGFPVGLALYQAAAWTKP